MWWVARVWTKTCVIVVVAVLAFLNLEGEAWGRVLVISSGAGCCWHGERMLRMPEMLSEGSSIRECHSVMATVHHVIAACKIPSHCCSATPLSMLVHCTLLYQGRLMYPWSSRFSGTWNRVNRKISGIWLCQFLCLSSHVSQSTVNYNVSGKARH